MKIVAALQSSYIPWKGYFDIIRQADEFILYDDVQYTKNDWRNRNIIKSTQGSQWLTIPVYGKIDLLIQEVTVANQALWPTKHWKSIISNYSRAPFFKEHSNLFNELYEQCKSINLLSQINYLFITNICKILEINTSISWSTHYALPAHTEIDKTARLVELCQKAHATHYLSGPAGQNYIKQELFERVGINVLYVDYKQYPVYSQLYGDFTHQVSILDLLFHTGKKALEYLSPIQNSGLLI